MSFSKKLTYLLYKIFNEVFIKANRKNLYGDIVFSKNNIKLEAPALILFDFSHPTTHLGDRLFFAPLIFELCGLGFKILLSKEDKITKSLFNELKNSIVLGEHNGDTHVDLVVIPSPSLLAFRSKYLNTPTVICQFTLIKKQSILAELAQAFSQITNRTIGSLALSESCVGLQSNLLRKNDKYFLFSNYIDSGWFRKFFLNITCLEEQAVRLRNDGFKIIHVGSSRDLAGDKNNYEFIDIDLRGVLSVAELVCLANTKEVVGAVTYDNVIMHLIGIFDKRALVLFRGRFLKSNRALHYAFINPVFFKQDNKIEYLQ